MRVEFPSKFTSRVSVSRVTNETNLMRLTSGLIYAACRKTRKVL